MKIKIYRIVTAVLTILWLAMIFSLSNDTAAQSSELSGGILKWLFSVFYPDFEEFGPEMQQQLIEPFSFIIRKAAHFVIYFILGILTSASFISYTALKYKLRALYSMGFCVVAAIFDEIHQLFVDGRSGEIRDVLIDSAASIIAAICFYSLIKFILKRRGKDA